MILEMKFFSMIKQFLSNEQRISGAFGARDFASRLGIFFKNSPAIVKKNNDALW